MGARVADESRILRFGITVDGKRARWWRLRSGAKSAELYLEREGSGRHAHLSMRRSGKWHLDVNGDWPVQWQRPPGLALDRRRMFAVVQHIGMAVVVEPAVERAVWHPVPVDTDWTIATAFNVDRGSRYRSRGVARQGRRNGVHRAALHRRGPRYLLRRRGPGAA
jgi:hypothetical protein